MKFLFALILSTSGFQAQAAPTADSLTIGVSAEFESLHPSIANQATATYMLYLAWRHLIIMDQDNKWMPLLIKELPTLKNKLLKKNGKGLDATIEILAAAKWSDETPVTCKDLELGWQIGLNQNVSIPTRDSYEEISSVTTDPNNPKKCTVSFKTSKFDYLTNFPRLVPAHIEGEIFNKNKDIAQGYEKNSTYTKNPTAAGLWLGPYVVSEVKLGSHVVFTRNPHFHGKKPYFNRVIFKLIPNNGTLITNLRAGTIDMISPAGGLGIDQAVQFERNVKADKLPYSVEFSDGNIYAHIDLNLDNPILKDHKVRQALVLGFNRKEAIESLLEGRGKLAKHFVTERDPWHNPKIKQYDFNRREANRLLDEAGWKRGADGIRAKDGKRMTLTLMGSSGNKLIDMIEAYVQTQWKDIGIEILIKNEPPRVYFGETLKKRKFEMAMFSWVSFPENSPRPTLHSASVPKQENSFTGQNYTGWSNPEVDKLIDDLELELDAAKRKKIGQRIVELYAHDIPVIPIYYRSNFSVIPKGMKGYRLSGTVFHDTLFMENWTMSAGK